jgi:hypothetical protein
MIEIALEGSIEIAGDAYVASVWDEDANESADVPILGLDEFVTQRARLTFVLDYPFELPFEGEVKAAAGGSTLRQIIDAVRQSYRTMYEGTTEEPIAQMINKLVKGKYGAAFHVISDLVIESIDLDEQAGVLEIGIGS